MTRRSTRAAEAGSAWLLSAPALVGLLLFVALPFVVAAAVSLTDLRMGSPLAPDLLGLEQYHRLLTDPTFLRALVNNAIFAIVVVPLQTGLALALALLLDQPLRGRVLFRTLFFLPAELEDAARIDGAGVVRTFFEIAAPNAKPAYAAVGVLMFLLHWSLYLWPLLATTSESVRPLVLGIATFYALPPLQWGDIFAFGVLMVAPVMVVFVLVQRQLVRGLTQSGLGR